MAKTPYTPHRRLDTKVVPSKTDYDRDANQREIDEQLNEATQDFVNEAEAEAFFQMEMYEYGFHIEMPEN